MPSEGPQTQKLCGSGQKSANVRDPDRRAQKTRRRLHDALVALMHEKRYDAIVVKEILHRADVGRSAFYSHFEGKDGLLASGIEEVLRNTPAYGPLSFSRAVLEYVHRCRDGVGRHMDHAGRATVHGHLREVLLDHVRVAGNAAVPSDLLTQFVVDTFILVLNRWVDSGTALTPAEADDVFRRLVAPALAANERRDL